MIPVLEWIFQDATHFFGIAFLIWLVGHSIASAIHGRNE